MFEYEYENGRRYCSNRSVSLESLFSTSSIDCRPKLSIDLLLGELHVNAYFSQEMAQETDQIRMPNDEEEQDRMDIVSRHSN